ncbi:MAG: hypothetical protein ABFS56_21105 [Pseudomonadota bacterium]
MTPKLLLIIEMSTSVYKNASRKEYKLTNEQRNIYRKIYQESREAKRRAKF